MKYKILIMRRRRGEGGEIILTCNEELDMVQDSKDKNCWLRIPPRTSSL